MNNLSRSNRVISEGYEEATGKKCMEVLARPAHQSEVCKGPVHSLGCDSGPPPYLCSSRLKGECCASYSKRTLALQSSSPRSFQ